MSKQRENPGSGNNNNSKSNTDTVLIVNPSSSSGSTGKNWDDFYLKIKEIIGENPEVAFSKKSGDGTALARESLKKGFKNIIAIGGDGTINEVANGFFTFNEDKEKAAIGADIEDAASDEGDHHHKDGYSNVDTTMRNGATLRQINPDAVFGIIPSGTRNVLAKSLNLPNGEVECCKHFVESKPQRIDVISALVTKTSDEETSMEVPRIFLNAAEMGVAAEIIDRSKKIKDKVKNRIISTISSVVATLPTYASNLCEISVDDGRENFLTKMTMCVIANGKYLGGGFTAAPQASVSDGLLDILILKNSGSFKMLEEFISMKNGDYTSDDKDILYKKAKNVSIKLKEKKKKRDVTVTIDGEPIGVLPATFQVHKHALNAKI
jgi:diacylglycerol kinase (ATP)